MSRNAYLRHLANFAVVVEAGSMSGAAEQLGTSPSAMSESVKILENYFGQPLLERCRSGVMPSSAGLTVYEHCREMSIAAGRALDIAGADKARPRIRISLPVELASNWFHSVIKEFQLENPMPHISLMAEDELLDHNRYSRDLFVRVSSGELPKNINILSTHATRSIFVVHRSLCGHLNTNRLADIQKLPLLCKPQTNSEARIRLPNPRAQKGKGGIPDNPSFTELVFKRFIYINDTQVRIAMARAGIGAVGCIHETMKHDLENGSMVALSHKKLSFPLHVQIASPHKHPLPFVRNVASRLAEWMKTH